MNEVDIFLKTLPFFIVFVVCAIAFEARGNMRINNGLMDNREYLRFLKIRQVYVWTLAVFLLFWLCLFLI